MRTGLYSRAGADAPAWVRAGLAAVGDPVLGAGAAGARGMSFGSSRAPPGGNAATNEGKRLIVETSRKDPADMPNPQHTGVLAGALNSGERPPCMHRILSSITALTGTQLKQSCARGRPGGVSSLRPTWGSEFDERRNHLRGYLQMQVLEVSSRSAGPARQTRSRPPRSSGARIGSRPSAGRAPGDPTGSGATRPALLKLTHRGILVNENGRRRAPNALERRGGAALRGVLWSRRTFLTLRAELPARTGPAWLRRWAAQPLRRRAPCPPGIENNGKRGSGLSTGGR